MTDEQKKSIDTVGQYLNACRPPVNASTSDVAAVIAAWNALVQPMIDAEKPQP